MSSSCGEEVLFSIDTLSKIISYLPSVEVLNLTLTCKKFGVSNTNDDSIIEESTSIAIQELASEEQLAALPHYDGENKLADYHYLQLMREPLTFDHLTDGIEYVNEEDKSCVYSGDSRTTAFSNNILRAGKHYVLFTPDKRRAHTNLRMGIMRPGQANQNASGTPVDKEFFQNISLTHVEHYNNNIDFCLYSAKGGCCYTCAWEDSSPIAKTWDGFERASPYDEIGMLLNLDEGTLSVYKNGRKLGVMKKGLEGPYCWAVSTLGGAQVSIKRGAVPS